MKDTRMKNRYLLLRFIAFALYYDGLLYKNNRMTHGLYQYAGDIDELLGVTMEYLNAASEEEIRRIENTTLRALEQISFYLGENAFRLIGINEKGEIRRYPININIFETLMYAMTLLPYKEVSIASQVKTKVDALKDDAKFRDSLNNHRDSEIKVNDRYRMIKQLVGEIND